MHSKLQGLGVWALLLLPAAGCAGKLKPRSDEVPPDAGAADAGEIDLTAVLDGGIPVYTGKFKSSAGRDGALATVVDATNTDEWQQFDFDTGKEVQGDRDWDIGFNRFKIRTNGGETGAGGVYVVQLEGQSFDDLQKAPNLGFAADRPDSVGDAGDADMDPDNVFNSGTDDWYDYNEKTHTLKPKDITYVFASTEKRFFKFRIAGYYDSVGTPAHFKFQWKEIAAPDAGFTPDGGAD